MCRMNARHLVASNQELEQSTNHAIANFLLAQQDETWYKLMQRCDLQYRDDARQLNVCCRSLALARDIGTQSDAIAKPLNIRIKLMAPGYESFL